MYTASWSNIQHFAQIIHRSNDFRCSGSIHQRCVVSHNISSAMVFPIPGGFLCGRLDHPCCLSKHLKCYKIIRCFVILCFRCIYINRFKLTSKLHKYTHTPKCCTTKCTLLIIKLIRISQRRVILALITSMTHKNSKTWLKPAQITIMTFISLTCNSYIAFF